VQVAQFLCRIEGIGAMRTMVGVLVVAAAVLAACSGDNGDGGGSDTNGEQIGDPVSGLDGDTLCGLVNRGTVEKQFGEQITDVFGGRDPSEPHGSVACDYVPKSFSEADADDLADKLLITTSVKPAEAKTAKAALDAYLVNDGETVTYEPLTGLGEAAGFAGSKLDVRSGGSQLAVIVKVRDTLVEVVTKAEPDATRDQLRPIADELVRGVMAELR
jgi:hypothetical protein